MCISMEKNIVNDVENCPRCQSIPDITFVIPDIDPDVGEEGFVQYACSSGKCGISGPINDPNGSGWNRMCLSIMSGELMRNGLIVRPVTAWAGDGQIDTVSFRLETHDGIPEAGIYSSFDQAVKTYFNILRDWRTEKQ